MTVRTKGRLLGGFGVFFGVTHLLETSHLHQPTLVKRFRMTVPTYKLSNEFLRTPKHVEKPTNLHVCLILSTAALQASGACCGHIRNLKFED